MECTKNYEKKKDLTLNDDVLNCHKNNLGLKTGFVIFIFCQGMEKIRMQFISHNSDFVSCNSEKEKKKSELLETRIFSSQFRNCKFSFYFLIT